MSCYKCPYCNENMAVGYGTSHKFYVDFERSISDTMLRGDVDIGPGQIQVSFYKCPSCEKISIKCNGISTDFKKFHVDVLPQTTAIQYPDYVPLPIRQDYEEAYAILHLSPKASATLSRRCLQGMIRDFWGISKSRLVDEIDALKDKIHPSQWKVIDGVRRIGNIGAHMEKDINLIVDIEPDEAYKLIKLIELLIDDWYIKRHETEQLYDDIIKIDEDKKTIKSSH